MSPHLSGGLSGFLKTAIPMDNVPKEKKPGAHRCAPGFRNQIDPA
jgi:hypothetical protein